jgi:hypothetical protein
VSRLLAVRGGVSSATAVPVLETLAANAAPHWVTARGADVRGFDIGANREVYGPGHRFGVESDILVTNGLMRFRVGARNLVPHLVVQVYKDAAWRAKGYLYLSGANTLAGARLSTVTAERSCCVLSVHNEGEVHVWLNRGERMLRITHGSTRAPSIACDRFVEWRTTAPSVPTTPTTGFGFAPFGSTSFGGTGTDPRVPGSPLAGGRAYESTVDGGATRVTDANGLTRAVAVLRASATRSGLGVRRFTTSFDVGAYVATAATGDDLADYHSQLAAASEQDVRLR